MKLAHGSKRTQPQGADETMQILITMPLSETETKETSDVEQTQGTSSNETSDSDKEVFIYVVFRYNDIYLHEIHL